MGTIIKKYFIVIFGFCLKRLQDEFWAEEITQETFIRYYKAYGDTEKEDSEVKNLLFKIARNLINDHWKKTYRNEDFLESLKDSQASNNDGVKQALDEIWLTCETGQIPLTEIEKVLLTVLFQTDVNPKSNEEIALETGLCIEAVINSKKTLFAKIRAFFRPKKEI